MIIPTALAPRSVLANRSWAGRVLRPGADVSTKQGQEFLTAPSQVAEYFRGGKGAYTRRWGIGEPTPKELR